MPDKRDDRYDKPRHWTTGCSVRFRDAKLGLRVQQEVVTHSETGGVGQLVLVSDVTNTDLRSLIETGWFVSQVGDMPTPEDMDQLKQQLDEAGRPVRIRFDRLPSDILRSPKEPPAESSSGRSSPSPGRAGAGGAADGAAASKGKGAGPADRLAAQE